MAEDAVVQNGGHYDAMNVAFLQKTDESKQLSLLGPIVSSCNDDKSAPLKDDSEPSSLLQRSQIVPFGRSKKCPTRSRTTRMATLSAMADESSPLFKKEFVSLAVVGMVQDAQNERLLLTRRPDYMRSFPGAFVFPGGGVDETDDSITQAVAREVKEETGLSIYEWKLESLWESVYPPTVSEAGESIKAHHLVCYFSGMLSSEDQETQLNLCKEEIDGALWITYEDAEEILSDLHEKEGTESRFIARPHDRRIPYLTNNNDMSTLAFRDLFGIYPVSGESGSYRGIAQGSLFALEEFLSVRKHDDKR